MNENTIVFGQRLRELRLQHKLTQKELADKLGLGVSSVVLYEKSKKAPPLDTAIKTAMFFQVSLDWLCGLAENTETTALKTYDNVIRALVRLDELIKADVGRYKIAPLSIISFDGEVFDSYDRYVFGITFPDGKLDKFLESWQNMKNLLDTGTISQELYDIWLDKQINDVRGIEIEQEIIKN